MKRYDLAFAAVLIPLDYLAVYAAGWVAYHLRFDQVTGVLPVVTQIPAGDFMRTVMLLAWGWVFMLAISGVYTIRRRSVSSEFGRIMVGASLAILVLIVSIFFRREYIASRFIVVVSWVASILFLWVSHGVVRLVRRWLHQYGFGSTRVVVIGSPTATAPFVEVSHDQKMLGMVVVKVIPAVTLESLNDLETLINAGEIDAVYVADPALPKTETIQVMERCNDANVTFAFAADLFETEMGRIQMRDIAGWPMIEIAQTPLDGWGRIWKRVVDIVGSMVGIILFLIPGLIIALAIKADSAGPVFMRLDRVGQGQRRFKLWKFRSMIRDAHAMKAQLVAQNERGDGPLFKLQNDPRITRVGRFIRKTSIDELPQLFNVFMGTMSLVGPRPHEPEEVARYDRRHKQLLTVKPGMTGMAQVSGRSNLLFEDEARLDTYYIENWSLGLDAQILFRTPLAVLNLKTAS